MLHQAQAYIIRVLEESEQRPSFDLRGDKIVLGSPRQTHKLDYNLTAFGRAVGAGKCGGGLYQWMGCIAAQALAEIEQKLSLLVQGLVKARSDAVDGDGATTTQKWCQWTTEFTTAVIQQMALNVHALDQSTVNFGITESMVTDRAASEVAPFRLQTRNPMSPSPDNLMTMLTLGHKCTNCGLALPGDDSTNVAQNVTCGQCGMSDLSIRVWLANPWHGLINAAQLQMKLDEETTSNMVQQLDLAALTPVKSGLMLTPKSRLLRLTRCTTPQCGRFCNVGIDGPLKCTSCNAPLQSSSEYYTMSSSVVLSAPLARELKFIPPTNAMLRLGAMNLSDLEQQAQQSSPMQKYFKFWPLIDLDELNEAKNEGLGAVSGTQTMKQAKSLVARIESVIKDIDGTESARYKALKYLNSNSLTPRSERFNEQKHLRQALIDADLFDLFVAGVQGGLVLMDDSTDANSAQSSMAAIRTRHLVVELIGLQRAWTECQQTGLHEFIRQQELCATIAVTTIDPQVFHLLDAPATRLVKKLMPSEFLTKLTN